MNNLLQQAIYERKLKKSIIERSIEFDKKVAEFNERFEKRKDE